MWRISKCGNVCTCSICVRMNTPIYVHTYVIMSKFTRDFQLSACIYVCKCVCVSNKGTYICTYVRTYCKHIQYVCTMFVCKPTILEMDMHCLVLGIRIQLGHSNIYCMYVCMYVCTVCTYVCMYVLYVCMYCMYILYVCIYCMYVCTYVLYVCTVRMYSAAWKLYTQLSRAHKCTCACTCKYLVIAANVLERRNVWTSVVREIVCTRKWLVGETRS